MEVIAKGKFIRLSPKKARSIADLYRGKKADVAYVSLMQTNKKAAFEIAKILKSAIANAENNFGLEKNDLVISKITVDGGPVLKRYRFRAKGGAAQIKKRTSHITIVVSGEIMSKREVGKEEEKIQLVSEEAKNKKKEIEKPGFAKKEQLNTRIDVKNTIFRRKTG